MIHALRYTEELEKVGFSTEQAKKSVQVWMDLMDQNFATKADFKEYYFMTKNDMLELRSEVKQDLANLRTEFKQDLANLRTEFKQVLADLRAELKKDFVSLKQDFSLLSGEVETLKNRMFSVEKKIDTLEYRLTIKMGLMMATSVSIIAALITFK